MTAMMLLVANNLHRPKHSNTSLDNHLVQVGLARVDEILREVEDPGIQSFRTSCTELHWLVQTKGLESFEV